MPHFGERRLALSMIRFHSYGSIAANLTRYLKTSGHELQETQCQIPITTPCTLRNMRVHVTTGPGVGETFVYTIRINGADGNQTITLTGAETEGADLVNEDVLVPGDLLAIRVVTSLAAPADYHGVAVECETVMR